MNEKTFRTTVSGAGGKAYIELPFDPDEAWGRRARHDITGTVAGHEYRGKVQTVEGRFRLSLGPAWLRDKGIGIGDEVEVAIKPEGPQIDLMEPDLVAAFSADPEARAIFEGLTTYCRKNYMRWIGDAKRPETRARRIAEMMAMLHRDAEERGRKA